MKRVCSGGRQLDERERVWNDNQAGVLLGLWTQEDADLASKHGRSFGMRVKNHLMLCKMTREEVEEYRKARRDII